MIFTRPVGLYYTSKTNSLLCVGIVSNLVDRAPFPHILVANGSDYSTK